MWSLLRYLENSKDVIISLSLAGKTYMKVRHVEGRSAGPSKNGSRKEAKGETSLFFHGAPAVGAWVAHSEISKESRVAGAE